MLTITGGGQIHQSPATISGTDPAGVHHPRPPPPLQHPGRVRPLRHALQRRHRYGPVSIFIRDLVHAFYAGMRNRHFLSMDPNPAQLEKKKSGFAAQLETKSGSDL